MPPFLLSAVFRTYRFVVVVFLTVCVWSSCLLRNPSKPNKPNSPAKPHRPPSLWSWSSSVAIVVVVFSAVWADTGFVVVTKAANASIVKQRRSFFMVFLLVK